MIRFRPISTEVRYSVTGADKGNRTPSFRVETCLATIALPARIGTADGIRTRMLLIESERS